MGPIYYISYYFGYFLWLLIFLLLAIIFAKKGFAWVLLIVGAGVQLLGLYGTQKNLDLWGLGEEGTVYWVIYFVLLLLGVILIIVRRNACSYSPPKKNETSDEPAVMITDMPSGGWRCTCGRSHQAYESSCVCGKTKAECKNQ